MSNEKALADGLASLAVRFDMPVETVAEVFVECSRKFGVNTLEEAFDLAADVLHKKALTQAALRVAALAKGVK